MNLYIRMDTNRDNITSKFSFIIFSPDVKKGMGIGRTLSYLSDTGNVDVYLLITGFNEETISLVDRVYESEKIPYVFLDERGGEENGFVKYLTENNKKGGVIVPISNTANLRKNIEREVEVKNAKNWIISNFDKELNRSSVTELVTEMYLEENYARYTENYKETNSEAEIKNG